MTRLKKPSPSIPSLLALIEQEQKPPFLHFEHIETRSSKDEPIVQLADLFAGFARFSREKGKRYWSWLKTEETKCQPSLFLIEDNNSGEISKADKARFSLLREFDNFCKKRKLGVSLKEKKYLWTPNPENPVNFWSYEPQHEMDKAPTRLAGNRLNQL